MNLNKIKDMSKLYAEMSEAEECPKATKRLEFTHEAFEELIKANEALKELVAEVEQLVNCDILTDDLPLVKAMKHYKRAIVK